jgi:hypothetical protein
MFTGGDAPEVLQLGARHRAEYGIVVVHSLLEELSIAAILLSIVISCENIV